MPPFWGVLVMILGLMLLGLGIVTIVEYQEGPRFSIRESNTWVYWTKVSALIIGGLLMAGFGLSNVVPQDHAIQQVLPGGLFR